MVCSKRRGACIFVLLGLLFTASARPLHSPASFYDSEEVGLHEQDVERVLGKAVTLEALPTMKMPRKFASEVRLWIATELLQEGQIRQELPSMTLQTVPEEDGQTRGVSPRVLHLDGYGSGTPAPQGQQPAAMYRQGILVSPFISIIMGAAICVGLCVFLSVCRVVVRHRFAEPLLFEATARQDAPSSGLPCPVLKALPVVSFRKERESQTVNQGSGENQCPICLIDFEEKDELRKLPECSHYFHQSCVDEWFKRNHTCPLCRISLLPPEEPALPTESGAALEQEPGQAAPRLAPLERESGGPFV